MNNENQTGTCRETTWTEIAEAAAPFFEEAQAALDAHNLKKHGFKVRYEVTPEHITEILTAPIVFADSPAPDPDKIYTFKREGEEGPGSRARFRNGHWEPVTD